jgi:hypothetical protein
MTDTLYHRSDALSAQLAPGRGLLLTLAPPNADPSTHSAWLERALRDSGLIALLTEHPAVAALVDATHAPALSRDAWIALATELAPRIASMGCAKVAIVTTAQRSGVREPDALFALVARSVVARTFETVSAATEWLFYTESSAAPSAALRETLPASEQRSEAPAHWSDLAAAAPAPSPVRPERDVFAVPTPVVRPPLAHQGPMLSFGPSPTDVLFARCDAEARLYLRIRGYDEPERSPELSVEGGATVHTYECHSSDAPAPRRFRFVVRDPGAPLGAEGPLEPSTIVTPDQFDRWSAMLAKKVPADLRSLPEARRVFAAADLALAIACLEEILKFIPWSANEVPASAFTTEVGRRAHEAQRFHFTRSRLDAVIAAYRRSLT